MLKRISALCAARRMEAALLALGLLKPYCLIVPILPSTWARSVESKLLRADSKEFLVMNNGLARVIGVEVLSGHLEK